MVFLALSCSAPDAVPPPPPDPPPPIELGSAVASYHLSFPEAQAHRVHVSAAATCPAGGALEWWMPTWTPGSYLVREYARQIEQIAATVDGIAVPITKVRKNRWSVPCDAEGQVAVDYTVYARSMTVRENFVDPELGMLNGAATYLVPDPAPDGPFTVTLEPAPTWPAVATGLAKQPRPDHTYAAADLDELVDSPIVLGTIDRRTFSVAGVPHALATVGQPGPWDHAAAAADVQTLTEEIVAFWGQIPYDHYVYLNVLGEGRGGLEHLDSTLMITSRFHTRRPADYRRWLGLVSHEFFHTWNVKRMRPAGLGPFDYENETYTPSLWIAEGLTSYYDDLLLARAGLIDEAEWLTRMTDNIAGVQRTPGRSLQALSDSSFDAWIKFYRRDENSGNHTVSYYTKGAIVGWLLDAQIRRSSDDRQSLDDAMRQVYARHPDGFTPAQFRAVADELAGADLSGFFAAAVDGTDELDYGNALSWWGLKWGEDPAPAEDDPVPGWLGATTSDDLRVTQVLRDSPAWHAGVAVDDLLLAFDDQHLTASNLDARLEQLGAGIAGTLSVARRGWVRTLPLTLGEAPTRVWRLEIDPGASPIAARRRAGWLKSRRASE